MKDLKMTNDGELVINTKGELVLVEGEDQIKQQIVFLLRTSKGDYAYDPNFGANLEEFVGLPLGQTVMKNIQDRVVEELTANKIINSPVVYVNKEDKNTCQIIIEIEDTDNERNEILVVTLDMREGLITFK